LKDKIFIAWSGTNSIAMDVKRLMEKDGKYICSIGGNSDNSSKFASIGDTVIQQIKNCNQAIVIFQNKKDGTVSNNLFFELGYVLAKYGQTKVHCVKRSQDTVVLPSDFDNSFIESFDVSSDDDFADSIVSYFESRQKLSINVNKMYLINNRYLIHDLIESHYSDSGSKCSDYELAQYVLFYAHAAHQFNDEFKVYEELLKFKNKYEFDFSRELSQAVNLALTYLGMINESKVSIEGYFYIERSTFARSKENFQHIANEIVPDNSGVYDEWGNMFVWEMLAYAYMMYGNNPMNDDRMRKKVYERCIDAVEKTKDAISILEQAAPIRENNDDIGIISHIMTYVYGNAYLSHKYLNTGKDLDCLKKSFDYCSRLKELYGRGTVDSQLYDSIQVRYFLLLSEYITYGDATGLDELDREMYISDINDYINHVDDNKENKSYLSRIKLCRDLMTDS